MDENELFDALVELTAPDGTVYKFRYGATIPYAGQDYVVLVELEADPSGEEQILITRLEDHEGELSFVVAEEEDIVTAVFQKYLSLGVQEQVCGCGCEDGCDCHDHDCGCPHDHEHHDCVCGHCH